MTNILPAWIRTALLWFYIGLGLAIGLCIAYSSWRESKKEALIRQKNLLDMGFKVGYSQAILDSHRQKERPMSQHKKRSDLQGFALLAESHWKQFRPVLYKHLQDQGTLYDQLYNAGEEAHNYMMKVQEQPGYNRARDYLPAEEVALQTWIYLPDVEQEEGEQRPPVPD